MTAYDDFDDWLEMVIEFGYITLFAGAFPLASCVSFFCNVVEIFSDALKLTRVYRRPMAERAATMPDTWMSILKGMVALSVITNCLIFGVCSDQMKFWLPYMYKDNTVMQDETPRSEAVWVIVLVEHMLVIASLLLYALIPSMPKWVSIALERKEHFMNKVLHDDFMRKRLFSRSSTISFGNQPLSGYSMISRPTTPVTADTSVPQSPSSPQSPASPGRSPPAVMNRLLLNPNANRSPEIQLASSQRLRRLRMS